MGSYARLELSDPIERVLRRSRVERGARVLARAFMPADEPDDDDGHGDNGSRLG